MKCWFKASIGTLYMQHCLCQCLCQSVPGSDTVPVSVSQANCSRLVRTPDMQQRLSGRACNNQFSRSFLDRVNAHKRQLKNECLACHHVVGVQLHRSICRHNKSHHNGRKPVWSADKAVLKTCNCCADEGAA